jgi:hypothetical protein
MIGRLKTLPGLALACALALGSLSACSPEPPVPLPATAPLPGAWASTDAFSPEVQEAVRFAVQTFAVQNKARVLYKDVTQARQQVVAGLNFELQLQVTMDGTPRQAKAKVWRQPDGAYRLHSWDWLD